MKRKLLPIVLISLLLGTLSDVFFYAKTPGISVFLFSTLILAATCYLIYVYKQRPTITFYLLGLVLLFFTAMVFVRANGFLIFLNCVMAIYLMLVMMTLLAKPHIRLQEMTVDKYITRLTRLPLQIIGEFFGFMGILLSNRDEVKLKKATLTPIVRGVLLSIPFLVIFLILFSSADLVFSHFIGSLFNFHISPELVSRLFFIAVATAIFIGGYTWIFTKSSSDTDALDSSSKKVINIGSIESSILLGSVAFLFLVFVIIQITYLFGGESNVTGTGYTYAEYARKGFFELITVAVIALALIWGVSKNTVRSNLPQQMLFKWLSSVLIVEVLVIMLSAHTRLSLYEQAYGFTALRLYSHIFIAWLALIFIALFVHIVREQRENLFAFQAFISVIVFMAIVNFINPDAFIARQNIQRFNNTGKIDVFYLAGLSEDATPELVKLLHNPNQTLQKGIAHGLYVKKQALVSKPSQWQSSNIARSHANQLLKQNAPQLDANKDFVINPSTLND